MARHWKTTLFLVVICVALGPAADPPRAVHLPLTPFEILSLVHSENGDEAVIRKLKESGTRFPPGAPELRQLHQLGVSSRILAAVTEEPRPTPVPLVSGSPNPALGRWTREIASYRVTIQFAEQRLALAITGPNPHESNPGDHVQILIDADYAINPEGLLFGVITGVDCNRTRFTPELQGLVGHTFSLRTRADESTLTLKDVKALGLGLGSDQSESRIGIAVACAGGRYTRCEDTLRVDPRALAPRPMPIEGFRRVVIPASATSDGLERIGVEFAPAPRPVR